MICSHFRWLNKWKFKNIDSRQINCTHLNWSQVSWTQRNSTPRSSTHLISTYLKSTQINTKSISINSNQIISFQFTTAQLNSAHVIVSEMSTAGLLSTDPHSSDWISRHQMSSCQFFWLFLYPLIYGFLDIWCFFHLLPHLLCQISDYISNLISLFTWAIYMFINVFPGTFFRIKSRYEAFHLWSSEIPVLIDTLPAICR